MIIDSHCHLNYEPMSLSIKETIQRANNDGVKYLLTISTEDKSFYKILNIHCHIENDMHLAVISTDHRDRLVPYIFSINLTGGL